MNDIKVSVIIPIYNAEKHLKKCLETLINQTLKDIEIVCIDDGSTDNSLQILRDFSNTDNRIKILKQQHECAGSARNNGLSVAQGKYLSFLDSDDFFELSMLEDLYNCAEKYNTDIVICKSLLFENGWIRDNDDIQDKLLPKKEVFSANDIPKYIFQFHIGWCWNKLYKASFIKNLGISFQNIKKHNDSFFSHISVIKANRIYLLNKKLVYYRKNLQEELQKIKDNKFEFYKSLKAIKEFLVKENLYKTFDQSFVNHCIKLLINYSIFMFPARFYKAFFNELQIKGYNQSFFYLKKHYIMYIISSNVSLICKKIYITNIKFFKKAYI